MRVPFRIAKFFNKKLGVAIFFLTIGFTFLIIFITKDKVYSKSDLIEISASLRNYSFTEFEGYRNHTYSYYLYLDGYRNTFQIIADFVDYFDNSKFEQIMKPGDLTNVEITRKDFEKLRNQKKIKVFGLSAKNEIFLSPKDSIRQYNSQLLLFVFTAFIIVGFITFIIYLVELMTKQKH
jgi:hypothetical protein